MTLAADEFIRRFLLHTVPDGFHRIRHVGFLANGHRMAKLALCRALLDAPYAGAAAAAALARPLPSADRRGNRSLPGLRRRDGLILNENESYMQPGAALIMDNWAPTMKGAKIRGGHIVWATLPEAVPIISSFTYATGSTNRRMYFATATNVYDVTSPTPVADQERADQRQLLCFADGQRGR